jgi:hypothetical protein
VVTAYVPGEDADDYTFTSALPSQILRELAPMVDELVRNAEVDPLQDDPSSPSGAEASGAVDPEIPSEGEAALPAIPSEGVDPDSDSSTDEDLAPPLPNPSEEPQSSLESRLVAPGAPAPRGT